MAFEHVLMHAESGRPVRDLLVCVNAAGGVPLAEGKVYRANRVWLPGDMLHLEGEPDRRVNSEAVGLVDPFGIFDARRFRPFDEGQLLPEVLAAIKGRQLEEVR